jgi:hypothetical protein
MSALTGGRPTVGRPESLAQCSRKRRRCQRRTVSGVTITRDCLHPGPDPGQPDPEEPVRRTKLGPRHRPLVHGELVAQGPVLNGELAVAAEEEGEEAKHVEQGSDHRVGIVSGSALRDQLLACRPGFGERHRAAVDLPRDVGARCDHQLAAPRRGDAWGH